MSVDVAARIAALRAEWEAGESGDPALRLSCATRLDALRDLWREQPSAFSSEDVAALRAVSQGLKRPPPRKVLASPREVLKATFGFDSFRLGQEEIIDAVLAGRDCVGVMPTVVSRVMWKMKMAHSSGWETTNPSPGKATTGGTRRGEAYQEVEAGA